jgi:YVTN family beta-propeller protein
VWVATTLDATVWRIDPTSRATKKAPVGTNPVDVAYGDGAAWITNNSSNTVTRIDPATLQGIAVDIGNAPSGIAVSKEGVWVANTQGRTIARIDPSTNRVVATLSVEGAPDDVAVDPDTGAIWGTVHAP